MIRIAPATEGVVLPSILKETGRVPTTSPLDVMPICGYPDIDMHETDGLNRSTRFARVADGLRTLGDATRLSILQTLTTDCRSVSDIVAQLGLPQPLVSRHLRILRDRGFAHAERRGAFTFY